MRDRFGLIFVVLTAFGTLCILGSLAVLAYVFINQGPEVLAAGIRRDFVYFITVALFVLLPALIAIIVGIWLLVTGIRIGQRPVAVPSDKPPQ